MLSGGGSHPTFQNESCNVTGAGAASQHPQWCQSAILNSSCSSLTLGPPLLEPFIPALSKYSPFLKHTTLNTCKKQSVKSLIDRASFKSVRTKKYPNRKNGHGHKIGNLQKRYKFHESVEDTEPNFLFLLIFKIF